MEVEKGQMLVDKNDQVVPGQLLVSGLIGKEGEEIPVAAKGKVWGETWYKSHVELPLETTFNVFNGKEKQRYSILLGNLEVPVWGFGKPKFKEYEMEKQSKKSTFFEMGTPDSIRK